ncbi:MAG: MFS transporter [Parachlamydiaceae bacterium]
MDHKVKASSFYVFLGNVLEHHDKALFGLLIPYIGQKFFASSEPVNLLFKAYSALFIGMLMRPLGGILLGILADRWGRVKTLSVTILGMSFATLGIGLLPSYQQIGILAPILLTCLRGMQDFFAAGEANTAPVYLLETTGKRFNMLFGSFFETSTMLGIILASFELAVLSYFDCLEWWPFLFSVAGCMGLIIFYHRRNLIEQRQPLTSTHVSKPAFSEIIRYRKPLLAITLASTFSCVTYVMSISFANSFLSSTGAYHAQTLTQINLFLLIIDAFLLPIFGYTALRFGGERVMLSAAATLTILGLPLFLLMAKGSFLIVMFTRLIIVSAGAAFAACYRGWAQHLIPAHVRCTLLSIGSSCAHLFVSGPFVLTSLWAFQKHQLLAIPGLLLSLCSALALAAIWLAREGAVLAGQRALTQSTVLEARY